MNWNELDQGKYNMEQVFINQKTSFEIIDITFKFHNELVKRMRKLDLEFYARTHIRGISYMYNDKKAFMPIDIRKNHISVHFWTGDKEINGLRKGPWGSGKSEFTGSEQLTIKTQDDFNQILQFAVKSYEISKEWYEVYMKIR